MTLKRNFGRRSLVVDEPLRPEDRQHLDRLFGPVVLQPQSPGSKGEKVKPQMPSGERKG